MKNYDVVIVGGGMVGASLALALAPLKLKVALIEAFAPDSASQPSFDERTTALSNGSRRILETLQVWQSLSSAATPIAKIHVSDQGHFGFARIEAARQGLNALGYVVPNRHLGQVLWRGLKDSGIAIHCPARVQSVRREPDAVHLALDVGELEISAQLVVAADGADSAVRAALGVEADSRDYGQTAIITTVLPQRFHEHVAYERFTRNGPLALLPLADGRCTLVLTMKPEEADQALLWSDEPFIAELQRRFGFRLGRFLKVGRRVPYPLTLSRARELGAERCIIIGNAAQALHPVAGMGFNLGLRDAASLAELIADQTGRSEVDFGSATLRHAYEAWRAQDRRDVVAFTDGLVRTFASPMRAVALVRDVGLLAFDLLPPAKAALSRLSTGAGARMPKLARGVPLT
ncbi:MAG TPA: 2-octaprenyl-6-methoxyphenyl hydroxylase [Steroidobacteraceae bacterium]|jgi:2-octaprenyl-6-methoxyphenol hydroxylase